MKTFFFALWLSTVDKIIKRGNGKGITNHKELTWKEWTKSLGYVKQNGNCVKILALSLSFVRLLRKGQGLNLNKAIDVTASSRYLCI